MKSKFRRDLQMPCKVLDIVGLILCNSFYLKNFPGENEVLSGQRDAQPNLGRSRAVTMLHGNSDDFNCFRIHPLVRLYSTSHLQKVCLFLWLNLIEIECGFVYRYASPVSLGAIPTNKLYVLQVTLLYLFPLLTVLRFILQATVLNDHIIYGYMVNFLYIF